MEIVFYNSLMKPSTFFGMPMSFLKGVTSITGFMCPLFVLKIVSIQTLLMTTGGTLFIVYLIFQGVKDKLVMEILLSNASCPKKIGF